MNLPYKLTLDTSIITEQNLFESFIHSIYNNYVGTTNLDKILNDNKYLLYFYNKPISESTILLYEWLSYIDYEKINKDEELIKFLSFYIYLDNKDNIIKTLKNTNWVDSVICFNQDIIKELYPYYNYLNHFNDNNILEAVNLLSVIRNNYNKSLYSKWIERISILDIRSFIKYEDNYEKLKLLIQKIYDEIPYLNNNNIEYFTNPENYFNLLYK